MMGNDEVRAYLDSDLKGLFGFGNSVIFTEKSGPTSIRWILEPIG